MQIVSLNLEKVQGIGNMRHEDIALVTFRE